MYSTLCRLAMINSEDRHNQRDIRWIIKLEKTPQTQSDIEYMYNQWYSPHQIH